jgi:hypothetical protein
MWVRTFYNITAQPQLSELIKALVRSDYRIIRVTGFQIKHSNLLIKLFIQKINKYILHINNNRNQITDYTPGQSDEISN